MAGIRKELFQAMAQFSHIGFSMASAVFIGFGMGYFLDQWVFNGRTKPWFTFIFLAFGIAAGFKNLYQLTQRKDL